MMKQLKIIFSVLLLLLSHEVLGQTYNMTNGSINTCSGTFYDSGGSGGAYGNNQNFVYTICPDNPGDQVQLDFTFFDIENNWDFLTIYDGNTIGAPTLGTYTGTTGPGTVQATAGNASGCLTIEFESDASITYPGWAATISCFAPCQTINANLDSSNPAPNGSGIITLCQGDNVTFNGSATFSNSGAGATYTWDFDDGSTANGTSVSHTFNNEGVYLVNLNVTDPDGCTNGNSINQVVQVSTTPVFSGTTIQDPVICLGESTTLTGVVTPTPFNYSCTPPVSGTTFLPDGSGVSYETDIQVECFSSGATLTNPNQLTEVCIDIEHSYLGDLDIVLICPNGQQMDILTYPNGGGGTYLGNPWDGAQQANGAGDGLVYCFDNTATTTLTNGATQPATNTAGNTIVPGNYAPVGDFNDLVGCPLNGDWTIQITDNLGSDDGYIFEWGLEFDPAIVPGNYSFTPTIVNEQWQSDPSIIATNGNDITVSPTTDGNHCYTYEATDDFGCTYDTTICLTVLPLTDPACPNCVITGMSTNVSACDPNTFTYDVSGQVSFVDEPTNGQLIVEDCNGNQQTFNAPFTSPINYNLTGLPADGNPCDITATFTTDPNCTQTQNYTAPICPCNIDNFTANISACDPATDNFEITGTVEFTAPPTTGQLIVEDCNGNQTSFNAPFTSPINYTISNIPSDGAPCNVTAYFTDDATCTSTIGGYNNPDPCSCPAEAGTTTVTTNGDGINNYILCDGDDFIITPNGDAVDPLNVGAIGGTTYDPGLGFLIYSCPPTAGVEPNNDPCFQGALSAPGGITDINDQSLVNSFPPGTFTNNTIYFVQFTMYNYNDLVYNVDCWDIGDEVAIQYLNPITYSEVEDCQAGTVTFTIEGGWPEFNGGDVYTASNLSPATASFNNTTAGHGGTITISGLVDGDNYSFDLVDGNGCPITVTGGPFQGVEDPSFSYPNNSYCQNDADPTANITGTIGGTFTSTPAGLSIDANTGAINLGASTPNTYTVTYTTPDPVCFDSQDFTITILPVPFVDPIADQTHCIGENTNAVNFTGSAGTTFNWTNDNTGTGLAASGTGDINSFTTTGSGTSNITVTPTANGCTGPTETFAIVVNPLPIVSAGADQTICVGDNATITATGASTYTWDNGLGAGASHTISPGTTTTYEVTGTDANGCINTDQVTINVNPLPNVDAGVDVAICVGENTTLTATGASTYTWDNGLGAGASHTVSPGATTTYEVTGTDANGCVNTDQVTVTVNPLPTVSAGPDVAICLGENTTLTGTGASTYTWDNGLGAGASHTVSPGATTTYEVTGTDANGCVNTDQVTVTVNPLPTVSAGTDQTICAGDNATITATGASTYTWDNGLGAGASHTVSPGTTTTYEVTGTDANGCVNTDQLTINVNPLPNVDAGIDVDICVGDNTTLTATGASSYTWDNGLGAGASHTVSPGTTTTYEVTGTDANGCVNTDQVTVTVNPLPNVSAGPDVDICDGDNTTLTATGASTYTWDNSLGAGASHTVSPTTTTTYEVTGTDANGCVNTDQVTVTVNPLPNVTISGQSTYCIGQTATISATAGYANYNWSTGDNTQSIQVTDADNPITVTVTDANGCQNTSAAYSVTEQTTITTNSTIEICDGETAVIHGNVESVAGVYSETFPTATCDSTSNVTLVVNALPNVDAGIDQAVCDDGTQVTLTATGADSYVWDNGLGNGASHTFTPNATVTYEVTGTDANGCVNTDQMTVTLNPLPNVDAGLDVTICDGDNTTLTATGASTYNWDNGLGAGASHTVSPTSTTTYEVTGTDANGCVNTDQVTVTVNPLPTVDAGLDVTICDGDNTTLTATGASTYNWDNGLGAGASHTVSPGTTTTYEVTGTDANGCINTDQVTVTVNPLPTVDAGLDVTICDGDNTTLTATGASTYNWDNGLGAGASHTVSPNTTTTYEVTGTDANGCINTDQVTVTVNPQDDPTFNYDAATYCITGADPVVNITGMPGGTFTATPAGLDLDPNSGDISLTGSNIGNYTVTYTTNGPCPQSEDVQITITNAPVADFEYNGSNNISICQNGTDPTLNFINGGSAGTFSAIPAGLDLDASNGSIDVANSQVGVYTVTNDINLAGCAPTSYDVTLEINEVPTADISGNYTLCAGEPLPDIEIDLTGNSPWSVTYLQDGAPITVNANNSPYIINGATEGVYTLQSVSDANCTGDVSNNQAVVVVNEGPNVTNLNDYQLCEGATLTIDNFTSDNPNSTFSWNNTGSDVGFGMNGFGNIPSSTATNGTGNDVITTIEVTATANGCPGPTSTFTVEVLTNPAINFTADNLSGCVPVTVNFTNQNNISGASCEWDFGDGTTSTDCAGVGHTYTTPGCYDVSLSVTTSEGCSSSDTYSSYICVDAEPLANFTYSPNTLTINNAEVTFENTSINATSYYWDFSSAGTSSAENPVVNFPETPGTYPIELVAISDAGCTDTATSVVVINDELIFYVPNTFTPDGNATNEIFMPVMTSGFDVYNYELLIFNRWGEIVFESHNHQVGWDGTYRGKMMQDGTYVWKITLGTTETDDKKVYYGHVNLLR